MKGDEVTATLGTMDDPSNGTGPDVAVINAADLVIVSIHTSSGTYDGDIASWNGVTTPTILISCWIARENRWKWVNNAANPNRDVAVEACFPGREE